MYLNKFIYPVREGRQLQLAVKAFLFTNLSKMENIDQAIKIAKAIADKNRYNILKLIARNKEICCREILKKSHLSQPAVSHHLKVLLESKLVSVRREGQYGYFSFNKKVFNGYLRFFSRKLKY